MLPPASHSHPTPSPGCPIPILSRVTPSSSHPDPSLLWSHTSLSPCFLGSILLCPHPAPPCPQPNLVLPHAVPSYLGSTLPQPHPTPFPCHPIPISPCPHPSLIPSFSIPVPSHPYSTLSLSYLGFIPFQSYQNSSQSYSVPMLSHPFPILTPPSLLPIPLWSHSTLSFFYPMPTIPWLHPPPHTPHPIPTPAPIPCHFLLGSLSQAIHHCSPHPKPFSLLRSRCWEVWCGLCRLTVGLGGCRDRPCHHHHQVCGWEITNLILGRPQRSLQNRENTTENAHSSGSLFLPLFGLKAVRGEHCSTC